MLGHSRAGPGASALLLSPERTNATALECPAARVPPGLARCSKHPGQTWAVVATGGCRLVLTPPADLWLNLCPLLHSVAVCPLLDACAPETWTHAPVRPGSWSRNDLGSCSVAAHWSCTPWAVIKYGHRFPLPSMPGGGSGWQVPETSEPLGEVQGWDFLSPWGLGGA